MDGGTRANVSGVIVVTVERDLEDLIPGFLKNRREDIAALRRVLAARDLDTARLIGHTLKGVGAGYGFDLVSELGRIIETAAREGDINKLNQTVDRLGTYLQNLQVVFV